MKLFGLTSNDNASANGDIGNNKCEVVRPRFCSATWKTRGARPSVMGCSPESTQTLWGNLWVGRCLRPRAARFSAAGARASAPGTRPLFQIVMSAIRRIHSPQSGSSSDPTHVPLPTAPAWAVLLFHLSHELACHTVECDSGSALIARRPALCSDCGVCVAGTLDAAHSRSLQAIGHTFFDRGIAGAFLNWP